ncbi:MAG: N-acetylmuramoyl-L-alanine amidase [Phycisphaeraceae bacterium]|nr:N-acetylmuramoyl-L-alanine amidase [Phycisphaeraceae bacterium]
MGTDHKQLAITRREAMLGGGLAIGAFMLSGCGTRRETEAALPGPKWNMTAEPVVPVAPPPTIARGESVGVIPRTQWTSAGVARPREINAMNGVSRITVHHDGLPPVALRSTSDVTARLEQIRRGHISRRPLPFADIGYHYVIDPQGRVWEARSVVYQGAHVQDNNEHNIGILVLGNFNEQRPTPQALGSLDQFLAQEMARYRVPLSRVYTHQEIRSTECPGRSLQMYMVQTRSRGGSLASSVSSGRYLG